MNEAIRSDGTPNRLSIHASNPKLDWAPSLAVSLIGLLLFGCALTTARMSGVLSVEALCQASIALLLVAIVLSLWRGSVLARTGIGLGVVLVLYVVAEGARGAWLFGVFGALLLFILVTLFRSGSLFLEKAAFFGSSGAIVWWTIAGMMEAPWLGLAIWVVWLAANLSSLRFIAARSVRQACIAAVAPALVAGLCGSLLPAESGLHLHSLLFGALATTMFAFMFVLARLGGECGRWLSPLYGAMAFLSLTTALQLVVDAPIAPMVLGLGAVVMSIWSAKLVRGHSVWPPTILLGASVLALLILHPLITPWSDGQSFSHVYLLASLLVAFGAFWLKGWLNPVAEALPDWLAHALDVLMFLLPVSGLSVEVGLVLGFGLPLSTLWLLTGAAIVFFRQRHVPQAIAGGLVLLAGISKLVLVDFESLPIEGRVFLLAASGLLVLVLPIPSVWQARNTR